MVPAYTFTRFPDLPKELQLYIWSIATRLEPSHDILILPTLRPKSSPAASKVDAVKRQESEGSKRYTHPPVFSINHDSRAMALDLYKRVTSRKENRNGRKYSAETYINPIDDRFHFYRGNVLNYHLLASMRNVYCGDPIDLIAQRNINSFANIRNLTVTLDLFVHLPAGVWSGFKKLANLTIGFLPQDDFLEGWGSPHDVLEFNCPPHASLFGGRSTWLQKQSFKLLQCSNLKSGWRIPEIKIAVIESRREYRPWHEIPNLPIGKQEGDAGAEDIDIDCETGIWGGHRGQSMEVVWRIDLKDEEEEEIRPLNRFLRHDLLWYRTVLAFLQGNYSDREHIA